MRSASAKSPETMRLALATLLALAGCKDDPKPVPSRPASTTSAAAVSSASAPAPVTAPAGTIVFVSERVSPKAAFSVSTVGAPKPGLIARSDDDVFPALHRGSTSLFVQSAGEEGPEWLSRLEGGALVDVGPRSRYVRNPTWLGEQVVVEASYQSFRDLFLLSLDGTKSRLTESDKGAFDPHAHGRKVAYVSNAEADSEIFSLEVGDDGKPTEPKRLTWSKGFDKSPRWSPDGERIAFLSTRMDQVPRVFVMRADGGKPHALRASGTEGALAEQDIAWSPDGERIAFVERMPGKRSHLHVVRVSDGVVEFRSEGEVLDEQPSWSPDSQWLAFSSTRDDNPDIHLIRRDGRGLRRLTTDPAADWLPRWTTP